MPPLTNPTAITVIATCTFLTAAFTIMVIKAAADLRKFRQNLKTGDYAKILIDDDYYRAKLVRVEGPFYKFIIIDNLKYQTVIKSKIFQL